MSNIITQSLLRRAKSNGYQVLIVTLDTWSLAWRPADLDGAFIPFIKGVGNKIGFTDPEFRDMYAKKYGGTPEENVLQASSEWIGDVFSGAAHTWEDIALLRETWDGPIVLKGIQHPEDAKLAVQYGCQGIVVSNHGGELICHYQPNITLPWKSLMAEAGRQLDGAVGSLEMLPENNDPL